MKKHILLIGALFFFWSGYAQNISTDRPGASDGSMTIAKDYLQIETGASFYVDNSLEIWNINNSLFRYGVANNLELRLITNLNHYKTPLKETGELGISDLELGLKYGLLNKEVIQLAYLGYIITPTGTANSTADQVGTRHKLSLSHPVNNRIGFTYNLGLDYFGEDNNALTYTYSIGFGLTEKTSFFVEVYGDWFLFDEFASAFDSGFTYLVNPNLQFDFSFGTGLNSDFNFYAIGISWRLPD